MKKEGYMKKIFIGILIALLFTISFPLIITAADPPMKWRMPILIPRGLIWEPEYHRFCENIKTMSSGRLEVQDIYDGEGVPATDILNAVRTGLVEMGMPFMALHQGELPAGVVELGLPGGPSSYSELQTLFHMQGGWKDVLRKAYASKNLFWLGEYYNPGTYAITKKPINSVNEFKGMKIRAPGAYGKFFKNLGSSPVTVAFAEIYTSLASGLVDGADGFGIIDNRDAKFYEVAKYIYPLPVTGAQVFPVLVNMDVWKKLPVDLQAILETACQRLAVGTIVISVVNEKAALNEMLAKGVKMSKAPSTTDISKWGDAGKKVWPEYEKMDTFCKELIDIQQKFMATLGK
jgi:TRAP-type mannitol/chloroaromatic compound transport system substrate-binding protein